MTRALMVIASLGLGAGAMAADWTVAATSSMVKVPQQGAVPGLSPTAALSLAGNEREGAQVVVTSGDQPLSRVQVEVSELKGPGGSVIGRDRISENLVAYVHLPALDRWDPDPLPPCRLFDVPVGRNQAVWVTVAAAQGQPAGVYRGQVRLTPAGQAAKSVPLEVMVYGFSLPEHPFGRTAFGLSTGPIAQQHHVAEDSAAFVSLQKRYYRCLLDHLVSAYSIPVDIRSPEAKAYFDDPRMTSYVIPYSEDEARLRGSVDYLRANKWLAKGCFYPLDEPVTKAQYDQGIATWTKIRRIAPDAKIVAPFYRGPDFTTDQTIFDLLGGCLNIWCINTGYFNDERVRADMYRRERQGDELWWYVCCGPGAPFANFFVQEDAIDHRVLFWQQKRYGIEGLLYWSTTYWAGTADPWEDIATVKDINPSIYGDGSLLYPGAKVGLSGPVSSQRLELIRDGIEDYQYLCLLQQRAGLAAAQHAAQSVAKSLTEYTKDPAELLKVRDAVARQIEAAR